VTGRDPATHQAPASFPRPAATPWREPAVVGNLPSLLGALFPLFPDATAGRRRGGQPRYPVDVRIPLWGEYALLSGRRPPGLSLARFPLLSQLFPDRRPHLAGAALVRPRQARRGALAALQDLEEGSRPIIRRAGISTSVARRIATGRRQL
jgi:hypothetical protein